MQGERCAELVRQIAGPGALLVLAGDLDARSAPLVQQAAERALG